MHLMEELCCRDSETTGAFQTVDSEAMMDHNHLKILIENVHLIVKDTRIILVKILKIVVHVLILPG